MALRSQVPMASFTNVAQGNIATIELPVDRRYHVVWIYYQKGASQYYPDRTLLLPDIEWIEVQLDGVVQRRLTPAQLFAITDLNGFVAPDGCMPIFFSEPWVRSISGEDAGAWQLAGNAKTFQIHIKLAASIANPKLSVQIESDNVKGPLVAIKKYVSQTVQVAASGVVSLNQLPLDGLYKRLHFFENIADELASVKISVNQQIVYEAERARANAQLGMHNMTAQAGVFTVALDNLQRVPDGLPTRDASTNTPYTMRLDLEATGTGGFTMLGEVVGPPFA